MIMVYGGGIYCQLVSSSVITGNTIERNWADGFLASGGGIGVCDVAQANNLIITMNTIRGNHAYACGGAISLVYSSPSVSFNTITANNVEADYGVGGGAVYCGDECGAQIVNNAICGNQVIAGSSDGGALFFGPGSSPTIENCTLSVNRVICSTGQGGGISCKGSASGTKVRNTISWGNQVVHGSQTLSSEIALRSGADLEVDYSDVYGGSSVYQESGCTLVWNGNLDPPANPLRRADE